MVFLSVIIPTYNGERYLSRALESIALQNDLSNIEVLIVDDGSTDNTIALAERYSSILPIRLISKAPSRNWVVGTNYALQQAVGEFVCFLHQDDTWLLERLALLTQAVAAYADIDCFFTAAVFIDENNGTVGSWRPPFPCLPVRPTVIEIAQKLMVQNTVAIPAPVFKRELALKVGGLDEALWYTADWDFWLKLVAHGKVGCLSLPTVGFRVHADSQTVVRSGDVGLFRQQLETVLHRYLNVFALDAIHTNAACYSIDVNVALAAALHRQPQALLLLVEPFFKMHWRMLRVYFQASCISQRVFPRLRLLLGKLVGKT